MKYQYFIILFIALFSSHIAYSTNKLSNKSIDEKFSPCSLSINYTSDSISLSIKEHLVYLPKIELIKDINQWKDFNIFHLNLDYYSKIEEIKKNYKEIYSLSETLGLRIQDPQHLELYRRAADWIGTRYRFAGNSKKGIDCSGFTKMLFKEVYDKDLARSSYIIANNVTKELTQEELQPGDLVFFTTRGRSRINHVGVYLGDRQFVHASIKNGVVVSSLDEHYYTRTFKKAGRL